MSRTKSTLYLAVTKVVSLGLQLVSVRFYLQWVGEQQYGALMLAQVWLTYTIFVDIGFGIGANKRMTEAFGRGNRDLATRLFRSNVIYSLLLGAVGFFAVVGYGYVHRASIGPGEAAPSLLLTLLLGGWSWVTVVNTTTESVLGAHDRFDRLAILGFITGVVGNVAGLILVFLFRQVEMIAWCMVVMAAINGVGLAMAAREFLVRPSQEPVGRKLVYDMALIGLKSYVHRGSVVTARTADRLVVGTLSTSQLTAYGIAIKLPEAIQDVAFSMIRAMGPQLIRASDSDRVEFAKIVERNCRLAIAVGCAFLLVPCAFGESLLRVWLGPNNFDVAAVMVLLGIYRAFDMLNAAVSAAFYADGKPHFMTGFSLANALLTAGLSFLAFKSAGLVGLGVMNAAIGALQFPPIVLLLRRTLGPAFPARSFVLKSLGMLGSTIALAAAVHFLVDPILASSAPYASLLIVPVAAAGWASLLCMTGLCPAPTPLAKKFPILRGREAAAKNPTN